MGVVRPSDHKSVSSPWQWWNDAARPAAMRTTLVGAFVHFVLHCQAILICRVLAIQLRCAQLRKAVRRESAQEVHQIVNFTLGKPQRLHLGVEERILLPSLVEEFDDVPQSL